MDIMYYQKNILFHVASPLRADFILEEKLQPMTRVKCRDQAARLTIGGFFFSHFSARTMACHSNSKKTNKCPLVAPLYQFSGGKYYYV